MWRSIRKICCIDLDGVLNYYPTCWLDFVNIETGLRFDSKKECKEKLSSEKYDFLKDKYRRSDFKANLKIRNGALEFLRHLKDEGYFIVVVTRRPFKDYPLLANMTRKWLEKNNIPFDVLEKKYIKLLKKFSPLNFHVDDEMESANYMARISKRVFLFSNDNSEKVVNHKIIKVCDFKQIMDAIQKRAR